MRRDGAALEPDVDIRRSARSTFEGLEAVRALARQVDLRPPVAGEVVTRDPHPLDLGAKPAVVGSVLARGLARHDTPELLLAFGGEVILPIVAHAEVHPARAAPIAEQHRERAPR